MSHVEGINTMLKQIRALLIKFKSKPMLLEQKHDGSNTMVLLIQCERCHNFNYAEKIGQDPFNRPNLCEFCKASYDRWMGKTE